MRTIVEPQNARSQRTRTAILAAMREVLEEEGFEALTMAAVAERAGVSRRAVYLHFSSRTELVTALFDYVREVDGLEESQRPVWEAPDAVTALDEWARHLARYHPGVLAVDRAAQRVRDNDPDSAAHRERVAKMQQANAKRLMSWLARDGRLAPRWTVETAADMLWALNSSDVVERLVVERRWSRTRFAEQLAVLLRATFVADADEARHKGEGRHGVSSASGRPAPSGRKRGSRKTSA